SEELRKMPYMHCDYQEMKCQFLDKRFSELTMMVLKRQIVSCDMLVRMVMIDMKLLVVENETADTLADDVDMVFCSTDIGSSIRSVPVTRSAPVTRSTPVTRSGPVTRSAPVTRSGPGRGLQVTQNVEDSHVTLTPVNPDGSQESSSMSSFMTSEAPIPPPTIPSIILDNLPTFNSAFRFEERLRSLETSFFEYRQTNPFADAVSAILDKLADVNAPSGQAPVMAPPVRTDDQILPRIRTTTSSGPLQLPPPFYQFTYSSSGIRYNMTRKLEATGVSWMNSERIWEEFTQSIHTFIKDKQNLSRHTTRRKKATLIVIPSIRFTKLIIHHLQRRHRFHPRPDSLLHLPNEEPVLGYLKFSAKGTKREVFGMPIPGSDQDSPTPKPTKPARKPKSTAPKAPPRPAVSIQVTLAQPAPTSAPAKPQEKKRKQAIETFDKPPKVKKSKYGFTGKKRSLKSVATSEAEDVPVMEPQVPGKGKAKVTEEQVAHDLLSLQKPKKTSPVDQYIFQRSVSEPTRSSRHDESPYVVLGQSDSEEESKKVVLGADEGGQDEGQAGPDPGAQAKGQTGSDADARYEGQARSNPDGNSKGQAGPDPGNAGDDVQSIPSPMVHARSDGEHMDLDIADVSLQPSTEQLDEGFTATAYPKVQENLKLTVEEQVLLEEPASSLGTLSSLQHLSKDISFGDLFFSNKPSDADKNVETEVESMVNVPIQQDLSLISLMTSSIIDLTSRPESSKVHQQFKATTTDTTITTPTTTTLPPPQAQQQSTAEAMMMKRISELEHIMANLIQVNKDMEDRLDKHGARLYTLEQLDIPQHMSKVILYQRMWETESYKSHEDHMQLFEALEKSMNRDHSEELAQDLAEAR
nr:hypothetical protein [Tanacetum cinerariifolium]